MKRITPEEVVEAYMATGLKPKRGKYMENGCACAIGALANHAIGARTEIEVVRWVCEIYDEDSTYDIGFAKGFDGVDRHVYSEQGYEDGQAAWDAIVEAGLVE